MYVLANPHEKSTSLLGLVPAEISSCNKGARVIKVRLLRSRLTGRESKPKPTDETGVCELSNGCANMM